MEVPQDILGTSTEQEIRYASERKEIHCRDVLIGLANVNGNIVHVNSCGTKVIDSSGTGSWPDIALSH